MTRGGKHRSAGLCLCLVLGAVLLLPGAAFASSAGEEYVLTLPGVESNDTTGGQSSLQQALQDVPPSGVVGEQNGTVTGLSAFGSAIGTPGGIAVAAALSAGTALALTRRREES